MKRKKSIPLKEIIFSTLAVTFWVIYGIALSLSSALIDVGSEPHGPDGVNGLAAVSGVFVLLFSYLPLILAVLFSLVALVLIVKRLRSGHIISISDENLIKPSITKSKF